jgi:serine/threonine-protein kinase
MPTTSQHLTGLGPAFVLPGEVLAGKYKVERVLGAGGWGVVLAARNLQLGQRVAIKLLAREGTPDVRARMLREAQAAARIHSDHVVQVYDVGSTESDTPYIVMEYLEGQDLASLLQRSGAVPVALAVHWILQACEGLAAAQRHGIVHRDLKPANLFLERRTDGSARLKVLDFGIAKLPDVTGITEAGGFMGSPAYMAPEQLLDPRDVDARTDVWGLGVVLYELLSAQRPFPAQAPLALFQQVREQAPPSLGLLCKDVPLSLSLVVERCLAKSRDDRWPGVGALARALAPFAPAQAAELIAGIERISSGGNEQLTLGSDASAVPWPLPASGVRLAASAESDREPSGLAATLAGPHVLRSRLLLATLLLLGVAGLVLALRRTPSRVAVAPPAALTAAATSVDSATAPAAAPQATPASPAPEVRREPPARPPEQAPPEAAAAAPARPAPKGSARASSSGHATPAPVSAPPGAAHAAAPSRSEAAPLEQGTSTTPEKPAGGPLPIDRRGPWE